MPEQIPTQPPEQEPTAEQALMSQYAGFAETILDAQLNGIDPDRTLATSMQGFLEQNASTLPTDVVNRLSDKRLELVRRISQREEATQP